MAFMEFLVGNGASYSAVVNHISAVKAMLGLHGLPLAMFDSPRIKLFIKSVQMNRPITVSIPSIIDIPLLHKIVQSVIQCIWVRFSKPSICWLFIAS